MEGSKAVGPGFKCSAAVLAIILLGACEGKREQEVVAAIETTIFGADTSSRNVEAPCVIRPRTSVGVKSEVSGRVDKVYGEVGQRVSKGEMLALIDTRSLTNELERNELSQQRTKASISLTEVQLERARRALAVINRINADSEYLPDKIRNSALLGRYGVEALEVKEQEAAVLQLTLTLRDLELQERNIRRNLSLSEIRAPLDGVVVARSVEEGSVVGSGISQVGGGDILFEVADTTRLRAECFARESESFEIKQGLSARIVADQRSGRAVDGVLTRVAPSIELVSGVPRLKFESEFSPPDGSWRVGGGAAIFVDTGPSEKGPSREIPASAAREMEGGIYTYVRVGRAFERRRIEAVKRNGAWFVESGLEDGDLVAIDFDEAAR